jgi:predicted transcriptional regulator
MKESNNPKHTRTMQVSVNISDEEYKLLTEIAEVTGRSNSALAGEWIKRGIYEEIQNLSKVDEWRRKRLPQQKPKAED